MTAGVYSFISEKKGVFPATYFQVSHSSWMFLFSELEFRDRVTMMVITTAVTMKKPY